MISLGFPPDFPSKTRTKTSEAFSPGHGASGAGAAKFGTSVLHKKSENMVEIYGKIYGNLLEIYCKIYGNLWQKRETMEICKETCSQTGFHWVHRWFTMTLGWNLDFTWQLLLLLKCRV